MHVDRVHEAVDLNHIPYARQITQSFVSVMMSGSQCHKHAVLLFRSYLAITKRIVLFSAMV